MEKGHEASVMDKIERKDTDYTGYSEKQADLQLDKGFKSGQMTAKSVAKAIKKDEKKPVTVFQKDQK